MHRGTALLRDGQGNTSGHAFKLNRLITLALRKRSRDVPGLAVQHDVAAQTIGRDVAFFGLRTDDAVARNADSVEDRSLGRAEDRSIVARGDRHVRSVTMNVDVPLR